MAKVLCAMCRQMAYDSECVRSAANVYAHDDCFHKAVSYARRSDTKHGAWPAGTRVRSLVRLVEADFPTKGHTHTHAEIGDEGAVEYVNEDYLPTVRFDRTRTATTVYAGVEVEACNRRPPHHDFEVPSGPL